MCLLFSAEADASLTKFQKKQKAESQIQGERVTGYRAKVKTTQEIMVAAAIKQNNGKLKEVVGRAPRKSLEEVLKKNGITKKNHPDSPQVASLPNKSNLVGDDPFSPPGTDNTTTSTLGIGFTAATFSDAPVPNIYVHDVMGAMGPEQYIWTGNGGIRSFHVDRKHGTVEPDGILEAPLSTFLNISAETSGEGNSIISDPVIRFDPFSERWYVMCVAFTGRFFSDFVDPINNFLCLAVSDGPVITPSTKWRILQIPHNQIPDSNGQSGDNDTIMDFPSMGIDRHAVYIGVDIFGGPPIGVDATAYVIQKESLLDESTPLVITAFRHLLDTNAFTGPFAPTGIDNFDPDSEFGYFIGTDAFSFGLLQLIRVINPGSDNPTISQTIPIVVPATSNGLHSSYRGNFAGFFASVDTGGDITHAGHVRNGKLFTNVCQAIGVDKDGVAHDSGLDDRDAVRWYELDLKGNDVVEGPNTVPTLVQVGTIWDPTDTSDPLNFCFGAMMTSANGDITVSCSEMSALVTPNAVTFRRKASDPLGTIGPKQFLTTSEELYNNGVFPQQFVRWGDYSYTSFDPEDPDAQWTVQEFVPSYGNFGMHVRQLLPNN